MEQNIEDILRQLKDSVSTEQEPAFEPKSTKKQADITTEALQAKLKDQYVFDATEIVKEEDLHSEPRGEYVIDSDFLNEALKELENEDNTADNVLDVENTIEVVEIPVFDEPINQSAVVEEIPSVAGVLLMEREEAPLEDETQDVLEEFDSDNDKELIIEQLAIPELELLDSTVEIDDEDGLIESQIQEEVQQDIQVVQLDLFPDNTDELIAHLKPIDDEPIFMEDNSEDSELPEDNVDELVAMLKPTEEAEGYDDVVEEISEQVQADDIEDSSQISEEIMDTEESDDIISDNLDTANVTDEPHETFIASMRKTGMDFTAEDIYNSSISKQTESIDPDSARFMEDVEEAEILSDDADMLDEALDASTINLMMQFCEKQELENTIGDEKVDEFLKQENQTVRDVSPNHVNEGKEFISNEQTEKIKASYKKRCNTKLVSLILCSALSLAAVIFELIPIIGIEVSGIFDYHKYPLVYALIGLQITVLAAVIWRKELWHGLKRAFSLSPTTNSVVALVLTITAIYDVIIIIMLAFVSGVFPHTYNALAALVVALSLLSEYLDISSQFKAFEVYSADAVKYTVVKESETGRIGAKMYGGGLEIEKSIYTFKPIDFPSGFFKSQSLQPQKNKLLTVSVIPALIFAMIASVIAIIVGSDAYTACSAFMLGVYALMPVVIVLTNVLPSSVACKRLSRRGSAFAGRGAIDKYCDCDVMVFSDLHIFRKCKTEDIGIAIYDNKVGYLVLGCLDALYSKVGGPLSGLNVQLPDVFKFDSVTVKRMTRNGIEAVIGGKHTLIVGEQLFMQRYGLNFPPNEKDTGRATLCVSLDGKVTAKLSVKYEIEPVFEMLSERLYSEGVLCAIETFDPLISSAMIRSSRTLGEAPISVIHGTVADFYEDKKARYNEDTDGIISCTSRLKLAETVVWLKKLNTLKKLCEVISLGFSGLGALTLILLVSLGGAVYANQFAVLAYLGLELITVGAVIAYVLPSKRYFTVDAVYAELEKQHQKELNEQRRLKAKQIKKLAK